MKHFFNTVWHEVKRPSMWVAVGIIIVGWGVINMIGRKYIPGYATAADKVNSLTA